MADVTVSVVTGVVERYQGVVYPHRGTSDIVKTRPNIIREVDNITTARSRRDCAVGVGEVRYTVALNGVE